MCKITQEQVVADGQAVGQALDNIAAAIQATDPSLATNLKAAGDALIAATENWKEGNDLAILTDAEQVAIVALNAIPVTSPFASLAGIAFAALNLLIANAQGQSTQTGNSIVDAHALLTRAATLNTESPYAGKAKIEHHFLRSPRADFEDAFNTEAKKVGVSEVKV